VVRGSSADSSLIVEWEGSDALEPIEEVATQETPATTTEDTKTQTARAEKPAQAEESEESETEWKKRQQRPSPAEASESSDTGSGDEYVEHGGEASGIRPKRKVRSHVKQATSFCSRETPPSHDSV
jgi:uncharacterized Zn finger protein